MILWLNMLAFTVENNAMSQPHFTSKASNQKIQTVKFSNHAQTIVEVFAKLRKSVKFEIFVLIFNQIY